MNRKAFKSLSTVLKQRMLLCLATGIIVLSGAVGYKQYRSSYHGIEERAKTTLKVTSKAISEPLWNFNEEAIVEFSNSVLQDSDVKYYEVVDAKGRSFYRSISGNRSITYDSLCANKSFLCDSLDVKREQEVIGRIRVAFTLDRIERELLQTLTLILALGGAVTIGMALLISAIVGRLVKRPLSELGTGAHELATGNLSYDLRIHSQNEIGVLAKNFVSMRDAIKARIEDLTDLNLLSRHIIASQSSIEVLKLMGELASQRLKALDVCVYAVEPQAQDFIKVGGGQFPDVLPKARAQQFAAIRRQKLQVEETSELTGKAARLVFMPLASESGVANGLVICRVEAGDELGANEQSFLETLSRTAGIRLDNLQMLQVIEEHNRNLEGQVKERTVQLQNKTDSLNAMLQNVKMGIFTLIQDGVIHSEYSRYLEDILETREIANRDPITMIFKNSNLGDDMKSKLQAAISMIMGEESMGFEANSHLLVTEFKFKPEVGKEKDIELDWTPIVNADGIVDHLLVTARDVTEVKQLKAKAAKTSEEMEIVHQLLQAGPDKFETFKNYSHATLDEIKELIMRTMYRSEDVIQKVFRQLHTLKGNARTLGFSFIADALHRAENKYAQLRSRFDVPWNQLELKQDLDGVRQSLLRYALVFDRHLAKLDRGLGQLQHFLPDLEQVLKASSIPEDSRELTLLRGLYDRINGCPISRPSLRTLFEELKAAAPELARTLRKEVPHFNLNFPNRPMELEELVDLKNALIHIVINALDHGIETPDVRLNKEKSRAGVITINGNETDYGMRFDVYDDGQGLNIDRLRRRLRDLGHPVDSMSDADVAGFIFESSITTASRESNLSGRGVGLDAARHMLRQRGGDIEIVVDQGQKINGFLPFKFVIAFRAKVISRTA